MWISEWTAQDFRNIETAQLQFCREVNVLWGENAQGKTNVIEGLSIFSNGRSFRGSKDKEMVRFGAPFSSMCLLLEDEPTWEGKKNSQKRMEITFSKEKRICKRGNRVYRHLSTWIAHVRTILFTPHQLGLVQDGPSVRRAFLDFAIIPHIPTYLEFLQHYKQVLEERNALLKEPNPSNRSFCDLLGSYDEQLAIYGSLIALDRVEYLRALQERAGQILYELSGKKEELKFRYMGIVTREEYLAAAKRHFSSEIARQTTLFGAHREDFFIELNGKDARAYASQGQQRSIALAMKLAEGDMVRDRLGQSSVYLLDDIFSELDSRRKEYIMTQLKDRQVILTTCDKEVCSMWKNANVYEVQNGTFIKRG